MLTSLHHIVLLTLRYMLQYLIWYQTLCYSRLIYLRCLNSLTLRKEFKSYSYEDDGLRYFYQWYYLYQRGIIFLFRLNPLCPRRMWFLAIIFLAFTHFGPLGFDLSCSFYLVSNIYGAIFSWFGTSRISKDNRESIIWVHLWHSLLIDYDFNFLSYKGMLINQINIYIVEKYKI